MRGRLPSCLEEPPVHRPRARRVGMRDGAAAVRAAGGASESKHTLPGGPTSGDSPTRIEGGGPKRRGHATFTAA